MLFVCLDTSCLLIWWSRYLRSYQSKWIRFSKLNFDSFCSVSSLTLVQFKFSVFTQNFQRTILFFIFSESLRASLPAVILYPRWCGSRSMSFICSCSKPEKCLSLRWEKMGASREDSLFFVCDISVFVLLRRLAVKVPQSIKHCNVFYTSCRLKLQLKRRRDSHP